MKNYRIYYAEEAGWVCDVYTDNLWCCSSQGETPNEALLNAMEFDL